MSPDLSDSEIRPIVLRLGAVQGPWAGLGALAGLLGGGLIAGALARLKQHREPGKIASK